MTFLKTTKYIFITGNNSHSGKSLIGSSLAYLLGSMGFKIKLLKISNYLNQNTSTLNPMHKGEVWITNSGKATSMDCGDYCHILGYEPEGDYTTSLGILLQNILNKENEWGEETLGLNKILAKELANFINDNKENISDFTIVEIGGNLLDFETKLIINNSLKLMNDIYHINVSFIPKINQDYDMELLESIYNKILGDDVKCNHIIFREPQGTCLKNIKIPHIDNISNIPIMESIYQIPLLVNEVKIVDKILEYFNMAQYIHSHKDLNFFSIIQEVLTNEKLPIIKVGIVGKDGIKTKAYHSIIDGIIKGGVHINRKVNITIFDISLPSEHLKEYDCLVFTGGYGAVFTENIMQHLRYVRQHNIPTLMISLSYQLALIELARHVLGIKDATSLEFSDKGTHIICLMDKNLNPKLHNSHSMEHLRLGVYGVYLNTTSLIYPFYKMWTKLENNTALKEKFRHRYWFNYNFRHLFEGSYGIHFSFTDVNNLGVYGFELEEKLHKFYVGVQFHPEYSTLKQWHPLFVALLSKSGI